MQFNIEWLAPIASALVIVAGAVIGAIWRISLIHHRNEVLLKEAETLRASLGELQSENARLKGSRIAPIPDKSTKELTDQLRALKVLLRMAKAEKERIVAKGNELVRAYWWMEEQTKKHKDNVSRLAGEKETIEKQTEQERKHNAEFVEKLREMEKQLDGLQAQDGRLWQRPLASTAPAFRPRADRGFPIISVLNLKGGVGKTTITAHLAGILSQQGKKVLMVDLDYQRSLSMMAVPSDQRRILHLEKHCLQHFLAGKEHGARQLLTCAQPVAGMDHAQIITNSDARAGTEEADSLEETEARLMAQWMVHKTGKDIRLFLREALHSPEMTRKFDYVLLDCPPRLTTASVNALAASDYVLIPVVLDALSARSLPELLRFLKRLREHLIPNLAVLGVVANLTTMRNSELVAQELKVWDDIQDGLAGVWGSRVPFLPTKIPNKSLFGKAAGSIDEAGELRLALADAAVSKTFAQLLSDIEKEIRQHERLHAPAISS
ncbi:ParA family protein [Zavarzinella formosa]|uniref:ParA family protein n=1 Tax=Zavarzinella formosa TaxID=360055 RepID=UPI0003162F21|nr:AAA family ATPase [Zavarzinella formosa]